MLFALPVQTGVARALDAAAVQEQSIPLGPGADPSVVRRDGWFVDVQSGPDARSLQVRRSRTLAGLAGAAPRTVWRGGQSGSPCCELWAPELQWLRGRWIITYAADDGANRDHRLYQLEADRPEGPWRWRGLLRTPEDRWAIDGTILELPDGRLYLLWSGWPGPDNGVQNLYIAALRDPFTVTGPRTLLSTPTYPWERMGERPAAGAVEALPRVNEGPAALVRGGRVFVSYSASGCWTSHYALGLLQADAGADLLQASAWRKSVAPVFTSNPAARMIAPGHNAFVRSADGRADWLVYHATTDPAGHCGARRQLWAQRLSWRADGAPQFGQPVAAPSAPAAPFAPAAPAVPSASSPLSARR